MDWKPSKSTGVPIYKQIANYIETRIMTGEFPSGGCLPSERYLATEFGVNRSTIISAYNELHASGLVNRVKGIGTLVSTDLWSSGEQKRVPNWDQYVKGGFFQLNNPINRQIYNVIQSGRNIINLAIGELSADLQPVELMQDVHSAMKIDNYLGYEHMQGNLKLREAISEHLRAYRNINSTPSSILITSGAQQALHLIIQSLLKPGDAVVIEDPSYAYSLPIFHSAGLKTFLLQPGQNGIDPEEIISLYKKHRIKMVFLNPIFQNPTGTTLAYERRQKVIEISTMYGIPIVEDDPYSVTAYNGQPVRTLKSMDQDGAVLYISSLSKIIASGLRIGWILGPQAVINRLTDAKQQIDFGHPNYPQWIAAQLLSSGGFDGHIRKLRQGLKNKRDLIIEALQKEFDGRIEFGVPEGGIHLWCKLKEDWDEHTLFKESIQNGVVFAPGSTLGSNANYVRLTFSRADDHLVQEGIRRFAAAVKRMS
ncbi:MocR-like pyridoxine biosynthesis transcription factor PdxR [Paenibacillus abyssi]|uniref:Transcriptional regulator n=1 Tax=Paenibacillus abyssi TaxID=1340531 RepID=A0A917D4Y7_9BACL|nr:PLP-dependent aminotransferase family protein [Paenibacillus abyssi]GGG08637.1 transcriptional regulator [Paenibacillus abyssi]